MSIKKKLLTVAAVSTLAASAAVPAMALENEFHGAIKVRMDVTNFQDGNPGTLAPSAKTTSKHFVEQRAKLLYMAKANDDLKLITSFEIDSRWGDSSYGNGRNKGGAIGADQVNIETKSVYLDFNVPGIATPTNVTLGIQPFYDPYKGIIFSNDGAGAVVTSRFDSATARFAFFRAYDNLKTDLTDALSTNGRLTQDLYMLDGKYTVSKDLKVGASYFLLYDDRSRATSPKVNVHMLGVNAAGNVGPAAIDGFFLYQTGKAGAVVDASGVGAAGAVQPFKTVSAFAAGLAGKLKVGPGTARLLSLYVSGDHNANAGTSRNDFIAIRGTEQSLYGADMMILLRNKHAINSDRAIVYNVNNANQGFIGGFLAYDMSFGKAFVNSNLGMAAVAKNTTSRKSDYMGTEINTDIGYKLFDNLTTSIQGAYMILGDYYKGAGAGGKDPDNPYDIRLIATYTF